ncbi:expressed unknown protein [Seminavis robusta]|uniref:Threonine/serine exporter-like N-terminal domain-containing protein n=1 Tax=Seminavis robusta TaxID=568900 RepID=A0A9N8EII0_9STRA|nr:expressed unknown protein [Seminavis robusta]|eukprot:Sro1134_g244900.1 n/a (759) ;mRNA; f:10547-12947
MTGPPRRTASEGTSNTTTPSHTTSPSPLRRANSAPLPATDEWVDSIRHHVTFSERRFDVNTLPADLRRVYYQLEAAEGEEYALVFVFIVRTACELHRAWHMTLLTSKILRQVIKLIFRVNDGAFELHRRIPYDYDSEFQDLYMKIAVALTEGHINVHEALIFQTETKHGKHTAPSGLFLRDTPGRLLLYPLMASTCTVIFFGGDWWDAAVAAITGISTGLLEFAITFWADFSGAGQSKILIDVLAGCITGIIAGLFYRYQDNIQSNEYCLSSIFLGTLYWFFYGTAFVIGLLEIIAGELETGVTRFVAVSVKTFVLALGSAIGLMIAVETNVYEAWTNSAKQCNQIILNDHWWRIPLYLLCSASALGQYRFPIANYWRGLIVQLVGYEVQYQMFRYFENRHARDFLDTASSNIAGAAAAVCMAHILSYLCDTVNKYYNARLLMRTRNPAAPTEKAFHSPIGKFSYAISKGYVQFVSCLGLGKKSYVEALKMEKKLYKDVQEFRDPQHPRQEIRLTAEEEAVLVEAIVEAEHLNIWALLMPAVYQLVPGSLIAKLWYNIIFPPPPLPYDRNITLANNKTVTIQDLVQNPDSDAVFYGLWVTSTSLALGLIVGFAVVQTWQIIWSRIFHVIFPDKKQEEMTVDELATQKVRRAQKKRQQVRQQGVMQLQEEEDDPSDDSIHSLLTSTQRTALPILAEEEEGMSSTPSKQSSSLRFRPIHQGDMTTIDNNNNVAEPTLVTMQMEKLENTEGVEISSKDHQV